MLPDIKSLTREELEQQFAAWNEPAYRAGQLLDWLYARRATSWDAMSNLPKALRDKLRQQFTLQTRGLVQKHGSHDTTQKFLLKLADGSLIESVLIPANPALDGDAPLYDQVGAFERQLQIVEEPVQQLGRVRERDVRDDAERLVR